MAQNEQPSRRWLEIDSAIRRLQAADSHKFDRDRRIAEINKSFDKAFAKRTWMTLSEFRQYQPLFDEQFRKKALESELSVDETMRIQQLSDMYNMRVDVRSPVDVVDDADHDKVLFTLPPVFMKLHINNHDAQEVMTELAAVAGRDDGSINSPIHREIAKANRSVYEFIFSTNDREKLGQDVDEALRHRLDVNYRFGLDKDNPVQKVYNKQMDIYHATGKLPTAEQLKKAMETDSIPDMEEAAAIANAYNDDCLDYDDDDEDE